jgi:DNA invertase Pin-like site-specific DNA recombinase
VKAALYCRVSTTAGQSVEMQLRDLRQLAQQRGFEIVNEFCDEGVSGSCDSRPQLDRMLADAQRGKFQAILIWRLDRLGRSLQHLVRLFENFRAWNVALISFGEGLDFSTSMGKLFYQLSGAFAEFERDCIRDRVRAGMRNARAKGRHIPSPAFHNQMFVELAIVPIRCVLNECVTAMGFKEFLGRLLFPRHHLKDCFIGRGHECAQFERPHVEVDTA